MPSKKRTHSRRPSSHSPQAFVVDDDRTQLTLLTSLLRSEGFDAVGFTSVEAALSALQPAIPPALIVTDLHMPGIDGWGFCRLLKTPEYEVFNHVPVLVVSATFSGADVVEVTLGVGANAFLPVPVDAHVFKETVKRMMAGELPVQATTALIVDDDVCLAEVLARVFSEHGYKPFVAHCWQEALDGALRVQPVLAVVDHHLPDGKGADLVEELRRTSPGTAVIMMTADPDSDCPKPLPVTRRVSPPTVRAGLRRVISIGSPIGPGSVTFLPPSLHPARNARIVATRIRGFFDNPRMRPPIRDFAPGRGRPGPRKIMAHENTSY